MNLPMLRLRLKSVCDVFVRIYHKLIPRSRLKDLLGNLSAYIAWEQFTLTRL